MNKQVDLRNPVPRFLDLMARIFRRLIGLLAAGCIIAFLFAVVALPIYAIVHFVIKYW